MELCLHALASEERAKKAAAAGLPPSAAAALAAEAEREGSIDNAKVDATTLQVMAT